MQAVYKSTIIALLMLTTIPARAEGLIHQLPEDGTWVRFEVQGEATKSDGTVAATLKGSYTISSVGQIAVKGQMCRWIELDTQIKFEVQGGRQGEQNEVLKLLIPEKYLTKGQNPCDHVVKAYKKDSQGTIRPLDLKGPGRREIQSMDELFHSPLKRITTLDTAVIDTKLGKLKCEGWKGVESKEGTVFTTETRLHKKAPFGVVIFRYEKQRMRNGRASGKRNSNLKLADYGQNAKSGLPGSQ